MHFKLLKFRRGSASTALKYAITLVALFSVINILNNSTYASSLSSTTDVLSRSGIGQDSNHAITFTTPSGVNAGGTIEITFPEGFSTTSVDYSDIDVQDDGVDLNLAALPNQLTWGAAFGGTENRTLTITSGTGTIAASSVVVIKIGTNATLGDQAINNPSSANTYSIDIAGSFGDTGFASVVILNNDQIQVNGEIYTTLSFSISDNAVGFGNFSNTNVRYATDNAAGSFDEPGNNLPIRLISGTNASGGLTITIKDSGNGTNSGLYSSLASDIIPSAPSTEVITNSKKFGVYGKNASSLTINEGFNNDSISDTGISTVPQTFASSTGPINGALDLALLAAVDSTTKAGSYIDTLTLICTGNY